MPKSDGAGVGALDLPQAEGAGVGALELPQADQIGKGVALHGAIKTHGSESLPVVPSFASLSKELALLEQDVKVRNELISKSRGKFNRDDFPISERGQGVLALQKNDDPELADLVQKQEESSLMLDDMAQHIASLSWDISQSNRDVNILNLQKAMTEGVNEYAQTNAQIMQVLEIRKELRQRLEVLSKAHMQMEQTSQAVRMECYERACKVHEMQQRIDQISDLLEQQAEEETGASGDDVSPEMTPWALGLAGRLQSHEDFRIRHLLLMVARHQQRCEELVRSLPGAPEEISLLRRNSEVKSAELERLALRRQALEQMIALERQQDGASDSNEIAESSESRTCDSEKGRDPSGMLQKTLKVVEQLEGQLVHQKKQHSDDVKRLSEELCRLREERHAA